MRTNITQFSLLAGIGAALIPGVLIFTIPMATLAGIVIGFSRMGTDSEIVAMRAAGIGSWTMLWPVLLMGLLLSGAATYILWQEAPQAAQDLERASIETDKRNPSRQRSLIGLGGEGADGGGEAVQRAGAGLLSADALLPEERGQRLSRSGRAA